MEKTMIAKILSFLPERKVRIEKGDMLVLDSENNIYFYRPGKGKISLNGDENILSGIFISKARGDYEGKCILKAVATIEASALNCNYKIVYEHGLKCNEAIMFY